MSQEEGKSGRKGEERGGGKEELKWRQNRLWGTFTKGEGKVGHLLFSRKN